MPSRTNAILPCNRPKESEPFAAPGDELTRRVRLFLASADIPSLRRIRVDIVGDTLVLSGRVCTFYERQMALARSRRVAGVIEVDDQIEVDD